MRGRSFMIVSAATLALESPESSRLAAVLNWFLRTLPGAQLVVGERLPCGPDSPRLRGAKERPYAVTTASSHNRANTKIRRRCPPVLH